MACSNIPDNIPTMSKFELQMSILKRQQNIIILRLEMLKGEMENSEDSQHINKLYLEVCRLEDLAKDIREVADSLWQRERHDMDKLLQLLINEQEKHEKIKTEKRELMEEFNKTVNEMLNEDPMLSDVADEEADELTKL